MRHLLSLAGGLLLLAHSPSALAQATSSTNIEAEIIRLDQHEGQAVI